MAAGVLGFTCVDAVSTSMIGMSPILSRCGVYSDLMDMDALHACYESHVALVQLGQMKVGLYRSMSWPRTWVGHPLSSCV
jgi:hypothetical protein